MYVVLSKVLLKYYKTSFYMEWKIVFHIFKCVIFYDIHIKCVKNGKKHGGFPKNYGNKVSKI